MNDLSRQDISYRNRHSVDVNKNTYKLETNPILSTDEISISENVAHSDQNIHN